jgi:hypothetical protein
MTIAWYDPTNHHVSTDKNDPLFTPLGQVWPLYAKEEWVGLTNGEMIELSEMELGRWDLILEVEAKLKEKNT